MRGNLLKHRISGVVWLKPITFVQARQFADKAHCAFGYLPQKPPIDELPILTCVLSTPAVCLAKCRAAGPAEKLMQQRQSWLGRGFF